MFHDNRPRMEKRTIKSLDQSTTSSYPYKTVSTLSIDPRRQSIPSLLVDGRQEAGAAVEDMPPVKLPSSRGPVECLCTSPTTFDFKNIYVVDIYIYIYRHQGEQRRWGGAYRETKRRQKLKKKQKKVLIKNLKEIAG